MMQSYLESYAAKLRAKTKVAMLYNQMGWRQDKAGEPLSFILGSKRIEYDSTIYSLILAFNNHILDTMQQLEHVIEHFKGMTTSTHGYTEHVIQDIMRFKLTIGMFKSTIGPLAEIIEQFFEIVTHPDEETKSMRTTHIAYIFKQISSQTHYLNENISVIADTSNAIQNIRANNIMKTLTMISSIFIPLSFIT